MVIRSRCGHFHFTPRGKFVFLEKNNNKSSSYNWKRYANI